MSAKLAIVVGCLTAYERLEEMLTSLYETTPPEEFVVIGINQVHDPETGWKTDKVFKSHLRECDVYIKNSPPLSVYEFWNQGIKKAMELGVNYIGIFNDDIVLPKNWWLYMERALRNKDIYYLFPKWTKGNKPNDFDWLNEMANSLPLTYTPDILAGFCFVCPTKTFKEIGLFDEKFRIHGGDTDFYNRLIAAGKYAHRLDNVIIHHYYSSTLDPLRRSVKQVLNSDHSYIITKYSK